MAPKRGIFPKAKLQGRALPEQRVASSRETSSEEAGPSQPRKFPVIICHPLYAAQNLVDSVKPELESLGLGTLIDKPWGVQSAALCEEYARFKSRPKKHGPDHRMHKVNFNKDLIVSMYKLSSEGHTVYNIKGEDHYPFFPHTMPKEGFFHHTVRHDKMRAALRVLNPIFFPDNSHQIRKMFATAFSRAWVNPKEKIDWAEFMEERISKFVSNLGQGKRCYVGPYLIHAMEFLGLLTAEEKNEISQSQEASSSKANDVKASSSKGKEVAEESAELVTRKEVSSSLRSKDYFEKLMSIAKEDLDKALHSSPQERLIDEVKEFWKAKVNKDIPTMKKLDADIGDLVDLIKLKDKLIKSLYKRLEEINAKAVEVCHEAESLQNHVTNLEAKLLEKKKGKAAQKDKALNLVQVLQNLNSESDGEHAKNREEYEELHKSHVEEIRQLKEDRDSQKEAAHKLVKELQERNADAEKKCAAKCKELEDKKAEEIKKLRDQHENEVRALEEALKKSVAT